MEGDRLARLTSRAVTGALALALAAFVGAALGFAGLLGSGGPAGPVATTHLGELGAGLRALRPAALATLGALLLLVAPVARLAGVGLELRARGERRAALMALVALVLLGASLVVPHPGVRRAPAGEAAPVDSGGVR